MTPTFAELVETTTLIDEYPLASEVASGIVIYQGDTFRKAATDPASRASLLQEIETVLATGPGVFFVREAIARQALDPVSDAFAEIIERERVEGRSSGDHFAKPGANNRVWNALEKLAVRYPQQFVDYYASDVIALAARAWLGPAYQVTSQLNRVNPGGAAQNPHSDYHLGFMSAEQADVFPHRVHDFSRSLTLQGAVAHCDMLVESGPTMLLPHSQKYDRVYLDANQATVVDLFHQRHVQLPMSVGDAMFFNPALMHGAGTNRTTNVRRLANLLQISSAFGRAMESVDRTAICNAIYPALIDRAREGWRTTQLDNVIAASAEGYAFPTNLDRDPPIGGLAPRSQADLVRDALAKQASPESLAQTLADLDERRRPN
jgi:ectoine hydroxylase-related dioxygenase (phytanoyl-CoA dioxygenase family)